jgi:hypothetical protein
VDSRAALLQGGKGGAGVVPRDPGRSTVLTRVSLALNDEDHMPPSDEAQLTSSQIALLKWWVTAGASNDTRASEAPPALLASARVAHAKPRAPSPREALSDPDPSTATPAAANTRAAQASADSAVLAALPQTVQLYRDIVAPMLANRCGSCHGGTDPDGDMRVDDHAQLLASKAIVPGKPNQSKLLVRARLPLSNDDHMPPRVSSQPAPAELDALALWIAAGASESSEVQTASLPESVAMLARDKLASAAPATATTIPTTTASAAAAAPAAPKPAAPAPEAPALATVTPTHAGCASCAIGVREARPPLALPLALLFGLGLCLRRGTRESRRSATKL